MPDRDPRHSNRRPCPDVISCVEHVGGASQRLGGEMQVREQERGRRLALTGRLDVHSGADVRAALLAALGAGTGDLVVDLAEVPALDATGLGVLLEVHRRADRWGRRLVLVDPPAALWRVAVRLRLHRVLHLEPAARVA